MNQPRCPTRDTVGGRVYLELRRQAKAGGSDTGALLQLYALEGFLDRLTRSPYAESLVLKGGVLLAAFDTRRPTRDIDVAGIGLRGAPDEVLATVRRIAAVTVDDGAELVSAVETVAGHRGVELHGATLRSAGFAELAQPRWALWRRRQRLDELPERFDDVLAHLDGFTAAVLDGSARGRRWVRQERRWDPA